MEEEIQKVKQFENLEGAIKVYKEFRRFKNDGFIESIDPEFFFNLVDYILENSIPISFIEKKIEILEKLQKEFKDNEEIRIKIIAYKELLDERRT